ncbi:uncharacterized protein LOC110182351 [Drosophila serrata]|uniref:uncharacterized protein LOC110182351 n=1 Tax=Drosophila serrata TaxID=7274 RepID=UPI000A1D1DCA|nr:uncharacterized protein LOC110182351 [Drosophila serrata]KAH8388129.1 hypothetical protein KR200_002618 [Drosophila serrata]
MKLLTISIMLAILHIQFYRMEPNTKQDLKNVSQVNSSCHAASENEDSCNSTTMGNNTQSKATKIANDAAEEAKSINEALATAAQNASYEVQLLMAERAMAAASTANSLMEAKQAIVYRYAKEIEDVEILVAQLNDSLKTSQANVKATCAALKMVDNHSVAIQIAMDQIKSGLEELDSLADQTQVTLEEQQKMMAKTKEKGECLSKEFAEVSAEFDSIKNATCRAISAALEAKMKSHTPCKVTPSPKNCSCPKG